MKVLVTGADGFAGKYMVNFLLNQKVKIYATTWSGGNNDLLQDIEQHIELVECDIKNKTEVDETIKRSLPDRIIHLAAQAFIPTSWEDPTDTLITNMGGTYNLLNAVEKFSKKARILVVCAANEYGHVSPEHIPIKESTHFHPDNPYAISKIGVDMIAYQYFISHGLNTIRIRAFSHTGAGQDTRFVCSNFAYQIAEIEKGKRKPVIKVGNLKAKRDFLDVRDVVRGYWLALEKAKSGEVYNICSGRALSIQEILDKLLSISEKKIKIVQDPKRMRPSDVPIILGDYSKFRNATGWEPRINIEQTLSDILDYWREKVV